jgi:DNA-binding transcriptional LysR family regulator
MKVEESIMRRGNNVRIVCMTIYAIDPRSGSTKSDTLVPGNAATDLSVSICSPSASGSPRRIPMARPEIRLLETAIVLAEELHFSRVAERLRVDQSTVSKRIDELESQLGFRLFERNHQIVKLTEAGRKFVEEARLALLHVERAIQSGRSEQQAAEVILNVGRSPYTDPFLITTLLSVKLPLFPQLHIELSQQFSCDLIRDVLAGGLDVAIATEPPDSKRLTMVKVAESPFFIAMSEDDDLTYERSVTLDTLAGRPWVIFERRMHPPVYDSVMRVARERKIIPATVRHIMVPEDAYPFIADDGGVAFVVKSGAMRIARDGITVRPLAEDALMLKTYLASRADERSKVVSELVRAFMRKLSTYIQVRPSTVRMRA